MDPKQHSVSERTVQDAIAIAKKAAKKAGINALAPSEIRDPELAEAEAVHIGRTSFAFELKGLKNAAAVGELEQALAKIPGVSVRIIYTSSMAWITAERTIDIAVIEKVFEEQGITAELTDSSLRRRLAWSDVEEGRYNRSHQRERRRRRRLNTMPLALRRLALEEDKALEVARREGFLDDQPTRIEHDDPTDVLFTARNLITISRLLVTILLTIPLLMISYVQELQFPHWQWVVAGLGLPVITYGAYPFHRATVGGFRRKMAALDAPSSIAILLSYFYSVIIVAISGDRAGENSSIATLGQAAFDTNVLYFDVACVMTAFLLGGRLISRKTRKHLVDELDEYRPQPHQTTTQSLKSRKTGEIIEKTVPIQHLNVGEDILVPPYTVIPVDGVIIGGASEIDGTTLGIKRRSAKVNQKVYAGTVNGAKQLKIRVSATGHRTWLAGITRWVARSAMNQNHSDALATKTASVLVPISLLITLLDFTLWALITNNINWAFSTALAVLGCVAPVALAVSASVAMRQGIEKAARGGVLIRDAETLRTLDHIDTIIFNRVGALSEGEMTVEAVTADRGENADLVLRVAGALTLESDHPVSQALVKAARESRDASIDETIPGWIEVSHVAIDELGSFTGLVEIPCMNSEGRAELRPVEAKLWRPRNLSDLQGRLAAAAVSGGTPLVVRWKGKDRGVITLHDEAKSDAFDTVADLEELGIETMMLSRDTYPVARRYGDTVGISHVLAGVQPGYKAQTVRSVHHHGSIVAMVGDASVSECFKVADVGVLVGAMVNLPKASALESTPAEVVLLGDETTSIPWLFRGARRMNRLVTTNFYFAWAYNGIAIVAACAGILPPMVATVAMLASSLIIEARSTLSRTF